MRSTNHNFLTQLIEESMRRGALLDIILANKEDLIGDVKAEESLGCSDHETVEFRILRRGSKAKSKITVLHFRKGDFGLFRDLLERVQ